MESAKRGEESYVQLTDILQCQRTGLFNLRFQHAIHQLDNPQKIVETKKTIAKILTVLTEKQA